MHPVQPWAQNALKRKRQRGLTLLEVIIALGIMSVVVLGASTLIDTYAQNMRASATAEQFSSFGNAANAYIRDNYAAVEAVATAATPALIRVSTLTATGYLQNGFGAQNSYGQSICALVLQPSSGQLDALVVTEAGSAINDLDLGQIAGLVGGAGGGVYSGSPATLTGTMGGWSTPIGNFANANSSGEHCDGSAGTVSIAIGHPVEALWFAGGDQTAGVLYRSAIPGQPSRNTMETPIVMDTSTIQTPGSGCATNGAIARDAAGAVLSCQSGTWKAQGSLYWLDPVANYASLPGTDQVGAVRMTLDTGRAFMWTGGAWAALGIDQNGDLTVPSRISTGEYVQINGTATAGAGCSPNGLVAQDGSGALLSCQSGVWKAPVGTPPGWSCGQYVAYDYFTTYAACSVYVPATTHSLMIVASATVGDMWGGGHGAGVEVGDQSSGIFLSAVQSAANGYTASDSLTYMVPSSYSGQWWTVYGYNSSGRGDYVVGYLSIFEVN